MVGIGDRIAAYLRRRGLSQVTLAGVAGRSESWLSHVERGQRDVDSLTAIRDLAAELGDAGEAIVQLLDAEQIAPQAIRFHPRSATPSPSSSAAAAPRPGCCTSRRPRRRPQLSTPARRSADDRTELRR